MEYSWVVLALISAVLFGMKDILSKRVFKKNFHGSQILFQEYLLLFLIILIIFFPFVDYSIFYNNFYIFLYKSFFLLTATFLYLDLLEKYEISLISPLLNLTPLTLVLMSGLLLGEKITMLQFSGILIIILATYFLEVISHYHKKDVKSVHKFHLTQLMKKLTNITSLKVIAMLFAFSFTAIYDKKIFSMGVNVYTNMYFTAIIVSFILFFYLLKKGHFKVVVKHLFSNSSTYLVSIFTIVSNFLILFAISMPAALVSLIIPLRRTSTLFSSLVGGIIFHEERLLMKSFSVFIMLIGIILIVI